MNNGSPDAFYSFDGVEISGGQLDPLYSSRNSGWTVRNKHQNLKKPYCTLPGWSLLGEGCVISSPTNSSVLGGNSKAL